MIRKTLLGLSAAAVLGAAALAPSAASAGGIGFGFGFGSHGHHGHHGHHGKWHGGFYAPVYVGGYYAPDCSFKKVKVWSNKYQAYVWRTKKICY